MFLSSPCLPGLFQLRIVVGVCKWGLRKMELAIVALFFLTGLREIVWGKNNGVVVFQEGHSKLQLQINGVKGTL